MDPFRRVIVTVTPSLRLLVNIEPGSCERVRGRLKLTVTDLNFTGDWSLSRMMMLRLPLPGPSHSLAGEPHWQAFTGEAALAPNSVDRTAYKHPECTAISYLRY